MSTLTKVFSILLRVFCLTNAWNPFIPNTRLRTPYATVLDRALASSSRRGRHMPEMQSPVLTPDKRLHRASESDQHEAIVWEAYCKSMRDEELFAVAPMMQHTNRHWHYFFRMLSKRAHLYTEMTHADQLVETAADKSVLRHLYGVREDLGGPIVLQIAGRNPKILAEAAKIGADLGYHGINLNCGCPSGIWRSGERGGAAMMEEPLRVAECCAAMVDALSYTAGPSPLVTVKHRLGVEYGKNFDPVVDHSSGDGPSFDSACNFISTVMQAGVERFHVHARLALLGEPVSERIPKKIWRESKSHVKTSALANRAVPPLRMSVVHSLAAEFPQLDIVANGGIDSLNSVRAQLDAGCAGAMVGRAVINHPCAFAAADNLWPADESAAVRESLTRGEVLERYIQYCDAEERATEALGLEVTKEFRTKLASVPYNLFQGIDGGQVFQRNLRRYGGRHLGTMKASAILRTSTGGLPRNALEARVDDAIAVSDLKVYELAKKSSSRMQRLIH